MGGWDQHCKRRKLLAGGWVPQRKPLKRIKAADTGPPQKSETGATEHVRRQMGGRVGIRIEWLAEVVEVQWDKGA